MNDAEAQMTTEERAACDAAYDAWVAKVRESGENGEPDAWQAGWLAGMAAGVKQERHDA